jgi:phage replication-related protein YjqB (UPF0714/DUF867 family)
MPPSNFGDIVEAGYQPGVDFVISTGNLDNLKRCLLVAPHGWRIEPRTSEIVRAVAGVGGWAYYAFEGRLRRGNWRQLHIPSTQFDEPTLVTLLPQTRFVLAVHGEGSHERMIYVGGLFEEGRHTVTRFLTDDLRDVTVLDGVASGCNRDIAGVAPANLANRGRLGGGVQLELSDGFRGLLFETDRQAGGRQLTPLLGVLAGSIDRALRHLTETTDHLPRHEQMSHGN